MRFPFLGSCSLPGSGPPPPHEGLHGHGEVGGLGEFSSLALVIWNERVKFPGFLSRSQRAETPPPQPPPRSGEGEEEGGPAVWLPLPEAGRGLGGGVLPPAHPA